MNNALTKLERRLRQSGTMVAIGLIVELISLLWNNPTSFLLFLGVGALLIAAGIVFYFISIASITEPSTDAGEPQT